LVPDEQQQIIRNIFDFGELALHQLMTPRTQVTGIERQSRPEDIWTLLRASPQSRFPVFDRDLDHVVGILHIKDFLKQQQRAGPFDLRKLVREAPRVAETARAETLLASFKRLKVHMAVVVDEHGGTAGIITMDDLLAEVTGDIDSDSSSAATVQQLPDGSLLMPGNLAIDTFVESTGLTLTSATSETMAGLLLEHLGRVPQADDHVVLGNVTLVADAVDGLVITRVRAIPQPASERTP
jgi:CBS domain containing-hemolysin-like protein